MINANIHQRFVKIHLNWIGYWNNFILSGMKYKKPYLIYLTAILGIFLLQGCTTLKTIEEKELKTREKIHLVALEDGTYYQIHSNRQVKSMVEDDHLVLRQNAGHTPTRIPLAEVDYCDVYRINAKKTGCSILLTCMLVIISLSWE